MCTVWPCLYSTCVFIQIYIFICWWCYFIEMSPNNILPLPYMPPPFMRPQDVRVMVVYRGVLMVCTTYSASVGYFSVILVILFLFLSICFFFPGFHQKSLCSTFTLSNSAIWSIFDSYISSYFTFIWDNSCNWSTFLVNLLVSFCCIWKLFWNSFNIKLTNERVSSSFVTFESILLLTPDFGDVLTGEST